MCAEAPSDAAPLIVIAGPTAAGKSALAMALCERLDGELISADSVQVYRGLDIGSAKPTLEERARVRHHCVDIFAPGERSDVQRWLVHADAAVVETRARGRRPIVCGGTGLYLRALLYGLAEIPPVAPELRRALLEELARSGPEALHAQLAEVDPVTASRVAPRDRQRIARALEVYRQTGRPLSAYHAEHGFDEPRHDSRLFVLSPERGALVAAITERAQEMLAAGWLDEVRALLAEGVPPDAPSLSTLGYREVVSFLRGDLDRGALVPRITKGHLRYAKRQRTWFRRMLADHPSARELSPLQPDLVAQVIDASTG